VRERLARVICSRLQEVDGSIHVFTLDPALEQFLSEHVRQTDCGMRCIIAPELLQKFLMAMRDQMERLARNGHQPVALVSPQVRLHVRRLVERNLPQLAVLSYNEIAPGVNVESTGMVTVNNENPEV